MAPTMMERRRVRKHFPQKKKKSIQDSVGNEENGYPVPDSKKTMINVTKEPNDTHIKILRKKFWKITLRNSWRK
jgi:hypothetical protein